MDPGPIKGTQIKVARTSSAKHKTHLSLVLHTIKEAKPVHIFGSRMALPLPAFSDGGFVQLTVGSPDSPGQIP
jgi:hypothetical protein